MLVRLKAALGGARQIGASGRLGLVADRTDGYAGHGTCGHGSAPVGISGVWANSLCQLSPARRSPPAFFSLRSRATGLLCSDLHNYLPAPPPPHPQPYPPPPYLCLLTPPIQSQFSPAMVGIASIRSTNAAFASTPGAKGLVAVFGMLPLIFYCRNPILTCLSPV